MQTRTKQLQAQYHRYKEVTGKSEVDMRDVAQWMAAQGCRLPAPVDPIDRLAKELSQAAREEIRTDAKTGRPYRANHAVRTVQGGAQLTFWVDIDTAPRKHMHKSLQQRREQMVGDAVQLTLDAHHWNSVNAAEEPIMPALDFTEDVEWRLNEPADEKTG